MDLATLKSRLSLSQVLQHYGLQPDRNPGSKSGAGYMLCCPFHEDKNPSMKVYTETNSVYCFSGNCPTHGHSLDVVDFVMWMEGWENLGKEGKSKAITLAKSWIGEETKIEAAAQTQKKMPTKNRVELLTQAWSYFQQNLSADAKSYLSSRALNYKNPSLKPYIGYNPGKLHSKAPKGMSLTDYKTDLEKLGLIRPLKARSYRSWAENCLIFPLRNSKGDIVSLYGRSTKEGHFYLKDRYGLFPSHPDPATKQLILTESIIDATSLLCREGIPLGQTNPEEAVLALYGTNGLTEEHKEAITGLKHLEEIIFFLDGDEAGEKASQKYSKQLSELLPSVKISQVQTPQGEDINSLLCRRGIPSGQGHEPAALKALIESRITLFAASSFKKENPVSSELCTKNQNRLLYKGSVGEYQILGGLRRELDSLKVTLSILTNGKRSRQKLDFYEDSQLEKAAKRAGDKLGVRTDLIELDLIRLTDLLESYREEKLLEENRDQQAVVLGEAERKVAQHFLSQTGLMKRLSAELGKAGVVGEERNRLFLFCCASSYKQKTPLHVLSQGASGMGKTHAQEVIAGCLPKEDVIEITRMTDYSFYNYGEHELSHKVLFIEDMDSLSEEAMLALREMQSKGRITLSTTRKDEQGNLRAGRKTVYGPLATVGATTKGGLYEDNAGRCFILSVDESLEQTRRIIDYQNKLAGGEIDKTEQIQARKLLQNCIRLLHPSEVINPFAAKVNLPEEAHKLRRLNGFFNGLIAQITWLHQLQRKRDSRGRLITEKSDVRLGIELFLDALVWKIDELDGSLRGFYERLKDYVKVQGGEAYESYSFGQREIRQSLRVSRTQLQRYISQLLGLEYLCLSRQSMGKGYRYKIIWWDDARGMRERIRKFMLAQIKEA